VLGPLPYLNSFSNLDFGIGTVLVLCISPFSAGQLFSPHPSSPSESHFFQVTSFFVLLYWIFFSSFTLIRSRVFHGERLLSSPCAIRTLFIPYPGFRRPSLLLNIRCELLYSTARRSQLGNCIWTLFLIQI